MLVTFLYKFGQLKIVDSLKNENYVLSGTERVVDT
jgi:hypothetical protein